MEHIFAVRDEVQLRRYREFISEVQPRLDEYLAYLDREFGVESFPRAIVWTDERTATKLISSIPSLRRFGTTANTRQNIPNTSLSISTQTKV